MSGIAEQLEAAAPGSVHSDAESLRACARDTWMLNELRDFEGRPAPAPAFVVAPGTAEEVAAVLAACTRERVPVVPYGGGSGVCGGVECTADTVVLSTEKLTGLRSLSRVDLTARFGSGTNGLVAEERVQEDGLTIGHWPQSIALSTVGGWVATRASGQYSTAYGNIEDVVLGLEVALADGSLLRTRETPRAAAGPDLRQLFLGSEGTLGVVTEVTFSLRELPEASLAQALHFESFGQALEVLRTLVQAGYRPPVARLYDARESRRHFRDHSPRGRAMLILLHEGPKVLAEAERDAVTKLAEAAGGQSVAADAVSHWMQHRNETPAFRSFLERGVIVDTIEVACTWSRVLPVYEAVTSSLAEVPGLLAATAHSSHSYRSGTNLYFSFAVQPEDPADLEARYRECWRRTMDATLAAGGGIAHHHGIGRVRAAFMPEEVGAAGIGVLRSLKAALDPGAILNPGNLLPPQ